MAFPLRNIATSSSGKELSLPERLKLAKEVGLSVKIPEEQISESGQELPLSERLELAKGVGLSVKIFKKQIPEELPSIPNSSQGSNPNSSQGSNIEKNKTFPYPKTLGEALNYAEETGLFVDKSAQNKYDELYDELHKNYFSLAEALYSYKERTSKKNLDELLAANKSFVNKLDSFNKNNKDKEFFEKVLNSYNALIQDLPYPNIREKLVRPG